MPDFWTYMLRCSDGSYYVGHTDDIDVRLAQHQEGVLGGYTSTRRPVELVWSDRFPDRDSAFEGFGDPDIGRGPVGRVRLRVRIVGHDLADNDHR